VKDDENLLQTNIIDSLGSFRMIAFLEETFLFTIEDTDMVPENFQTLNAVEIFIAGKLGTVDGEAEQAALEPLVAAV
jgi:acyl carrier protein